MASQNFRLDLESEELAAHELPAREIMCQLVSRYLEVIRSTSNEPLFSILPFLRFYGMIIAWEFGILLLPLVAVVNGCMWAVQKIRRKETKKYIPFWAVSWTVRAAKSLHRGEIPLMKFFLNRNIIRLFALLHVRGRARILATGVRLEYVDATVRREAIRVRQTASDWKLLEATESALSEKAELKMLLLLLPAVELVGKVSHLMTFVHDFSLSAILARVFVAIGLTRGAATIGMEHTQDVHHYLQILATTSYILMVFISCFIRKRELFQKHGIYVVERLAAEKTGISITREPPLDLYGWLFVIIVSTAPMAPILVRQGSDYITIVIIYSVYALPLLYALCRRFVLGER